MHPDTCFKESCESTRARAPDRCVPGGAELCPRWSLRNGARVALLTGARGCHRPWLGPAAKMYSPAMCIAAQRWAPWAWGVLVGHRACWWVTGRVPWELTWWVGVGKITGRH